MHVWISLLLLGSWLSACAELPFIETGEWRGYFAVHEGQRYTFSLNHNGEMLMIPERRGREEVAVAKRIKLEYGIEEMRPDGTAIFKKTRVGSLVSEDQPTEELRKVVVRGTTTGEAVYELVIEQSRDVVSIGGRVVETGELTEHPLRFTLRVVLPNVYKGVGLDDEDDEREFDKRTRRDYLELVRIDQSKVCLTNDDDEAVEAEKLTGSGVEKVEMRLSYYDGRRFHFAASRLSGMAISNQRAGGPWYEGMTLHWTTDVNKDPEAKSRLSLWMQ